MELRRFDQTSAGAGRANAITLRLAGRYFKLTSTVNPVDVYIMRGMWPVAELLQVQAGDGARVPDNEAEFDAVLIVTAAAENVKGFISDGTVFSDRIAGNVTLTGAAVGQAHTNVTKQATAASTQMLAADANRRYLQVQVPSTAAAGIRIRTDGGVAADDTTSIEILPGQSYAPLVPPTGAINMIRKGAANIDFNVTTA